MRSRYLLRPQKSYTFPFVTWTLVTIALCVFLAVIGVLVWVLASLH